MLYKLEIPDMQTWPLYWDIDVPLESNSLWWAQQMHALSVNQAIQCQTAPSNIAAAYILKNIIVIWISVNESLLITFSFKNIIIYSICWVP